MKTQTDRPNEGRIELHPPVFAARLTTGRITTVSSEEDVDNFIVAFNRNDRQTVRAEKVPVEYRLLDGPMTCGGPQLFAARIQPRGEVAIVGSEVRVDAFIDTYDRGMESHPESYAEKIPVEYRLVEGETAKITAYVCHFFDEDGNYTGTHPEAMMEVYAESFASCPGTGDRMYSVVEKCEFAVATPGPLGDEELAQHKADRSARLAAHN